MLYEKGLTEEQQEAIDIEEIVQFFGTEIGKDLLRARIDREVPFSMALPAGEVYKDAETAGEPLLVQGLLTASTKRRTVSICWTIKQIG
ncbi:hypothetical protein QNN00_23760 [Bacillus velezensis]|nr:hypothetical protein [Bacillus velezensis]